MLFSKSNQEWPWLRTTVVIWSEERSNAVDLVATPGSLAAIRSLDPDAWEAFYRHARPVLWRFARVRLATAEQAEDAVSETLARAMGAVARYRTSNAPPIAWLLGIERNVINEMYRAGTRLRAVPSHHDPSHHDSASVGAEDRVVADEEARAVRRAFFSLSVEEQELLSLRIIDDLDADTAAQVLGKRPGAVRMAQSHSAR